MTLDSPPLFTKTRRVVGELVANPHYRNSAFLMANLAVNAIAGVIFWIVAARLTPPEDFGRAAAVVNIVVFIGLAAKLGMDIGILRLLPQLPPDEKPQFVSTSLIIGISASLVATAGYTLLAPILSPSIAPYLWDAPHFILLMVLAPIWTVGLLADAIFSASRRSDIVFLKSIIHATLKVAALTLVIVSDVATALLLSSTGTMLLAVLVTAIVWFPKIGLRGALPLKASKQHVKLLTTSSLPNYLVTFISAAPASVVAVILLERAGGEEAALFQVLWLIGTFSLFAPVALARSAVVEFSHGTSRRQIYRPQLVLASSLAGAAVISAGLLVLPVFGPYYASIRFMDLLPFGLAAIPGFYFHMRVSELRAHGHDLMLVITVLISVIVLVVGVWLIPTATASGWLWLASLVSAAIFGVAICRHESR